MIHMLTTNKHIISWHLTRKGAQEGLRRYWMNDKSGDTAQIVEIGRDAFWYGFWSVIVFFAIGVMLAWRG